MNFKYGKPLSFKQFRFIFLSIFAAFVCIFSILPFFAVNAENTFETISVTADFTDREVLPNEKLGINFDREIKADEGKIAVIIGETDLTSLFIFSAQTAEYTPRLAALPSGENKVSVYLVSNDGDWKQLAEFTLKVKTKESAEKAESETKTETAQKSVEFTPNVALNIKGQNQTATFPRESAPERNPFTDLGGQASFSLKVSRRGWNFNNQFDLAGSSFRQEALRFGELGNKAPQIDLSSYLIELSKGRFKVNFGHVSFGSNRHLINSFSSRGINVTIPVGKQNEISFAAMNGTSIVGFDNFVGFSRRKHSVVGTTFAREFFAERPNGLRVEFSVMRGSLLPLTNVNQGEINDAEKSLGFGFKVIGSDTKQRLRYEFGITRSKFTNPSDPLLEQNLEVTPIREVWRTARYGEISFDFISGLKLWREKEFKLTGTFRHEEIQPLYRSIGVSTQADRNQNQFEISANFGEMNFVYGNLRDRDNLNGITSILKTLNRRNNVIFNIALNSFFTPEKPKKWLPQVSYTFDKIHQFGAFLPSNGEFRDPSQVPDQMSFAQVFNAVWQFSEKYNLTFTHNRAFQDNRQTGREIADFQSAVNALTLGTKPFKDLDIDLELSRERQKNFEQPRIDRTFRLSTRATWRTPFLKNSAFNTNISTTLAGDTNNFNDSRNLEFDVQWAYKFNFGTKKFKKTEAQFFIRYANRYGDTIDRQFFVNNFNKTQAFNFGLNFNIF